MRAKYLAWIFAAFAVAAFALDVVALGSGIPEHSPQDLALALAALTFSAIAVGFWAHARGFRAGGYVVVSLLLTPILPALVLLFRRPNYVELEKRRLSEAKVLEGIKVEAARQLAHDEWVAEQLRRERTGEPMLPRESDPTYVAPAVAEGPSATAHCQF